MTLELRERIRQHRKRLRSDCVPGVVLHDTAFRRLCHEDGLGNDNQARKRLYADARRRGISPAGKRYFGQLAEYPGDARALMSDTGDIKRLVQNRPGMICTGSVNAKGPEVPPDDAPYRVAPDIVEQETNRVIEDQGLKLTPRERTELRKATRKRISPSEDGP